MDARSALEFVRHHGIVLVSAKGPVPTLTHAIAGQPIKGSWWAHPEGKRIFALLEQVCSDPDVLVCRLVDAKLTLVHRRLWPALAALAAQIAPDRLCRIRQQHTASGRHVNLETPFPDWLPADAAAAGAAMPHSVALEALGHILVTNRASREVRD
jgi:phosphoketolase